MKNPTLSGQIWHEDNQIKISDIQKKLAKTKSPDKIEALMNEFVEVIKKEHCTIYKEK